MLSRLCSLALLAEKDWMLFIQWIAQNGKVILNVKVAPSGVLRSELHKINEPDFFPLSSHSRIATPRHHISTLFHCTKKKAKTS